MNNIIEKNAFEKLSASLNVNHRSQYSSKKRTDFIFNNLQHRVKFPRLFKAALVCRRLGQKSVRTDIMCILPFSCYTVDVPFFYQIDVEFLIQTPKTTNGKAKRLCKATYICNNSL